MTATTIAKQYVINEVRFLEDPEKTEVRKTATEKAENYQEKIQSIDTVGKLLAERAVKNGVTPATHAYASLSRSSVVRPRSRPAGPTPRWRR